MKWKILIFILVLVIGIVLIRAYVEISKNYEQLMEQKIEQKIKRAIEEKILQAREKEEKIAEQDLNSSSDKVGGEHSLINPGVSEKESRFKWFKKRAKQIKLDNAKKIVDKEAIDKKVAPKSSVEDESCKLVEQFLDIKGYPDLSWDQFANNAAGIFKKTGQFQDIANEFKDLADETSAWNICKRLKPYKDKMPPKVVSLFNQVSAWRLLSVVRSRINQMKK